MPDTSDFMNSRILKISTTNLELDILSASATKKKTRYTPQAATGLFSQRISRACRDKRSFVGDLRFGVIC
jgi:hypothetical protein